jgi:flagella basal body P-ring formation protein FlgA
MLFLMLLQVLLLPLALESSVPTPARTSGARMLQPQDVEPAIKASVAAISPKAETEVVECSQTPFSGRVDFPLSGAVRPPAFHADRPFLWRGRVIAPSGSEYSAWARVRIVTKCKVVRTRVALPAGTVLKADQLESVEALVNPLLQSKDETLADYAGLCLKRSLAAMSRLNRQVVELPPLVRRGSRVEVEALAGQTRLRFEAEAHANGRLGDRIELMNLRSGKPFWGVVSGEGSILIAIPR